MVQPKSDSLIDDSLTIDVDDASSMTLTATYMFNRNWAFDILAALPFEHDIKVTTDLGSGLETFKIAETKQLPATFSLQYHFSPDSDFQPYADLGVNWTTFSSTMFVSIPDAAMMDSELGLIEFGDLKIDDSIGVAAQIGGDWAVGENMVVNFDVRWFDIDADAYYLDPAFSSEESLGTLKVDPWFYALNIGFYF